MNPNQLLDELRESCQTYLHLMALPTMREQADQNRHLIGMAERFIALDTWLARGGYLPMRWHLPQAMKRSH